MRFVRVTHRGQRADFAFAAEATPDQLPLLEAVSDWYERGAIAMIPGYDQGESPSATITVTNPKDGAVNVLAYPIGASVSLFNGDEEELRGTCVRYSPGPSVELGIEI